MGKIETIDIGLVDYIKGLEFMRELHSKAKQENNVNYLILCQHYDVYTVGKNEKRDFPVETVKTDRGGSVVFHTPGQQIFYFVFKVISPMNFYRRVINAFSKPLKEINPGIEYIHKIPGFYIQNRKLGFLGFKYEDGYTLHGVAINYDVDLDKFNRVHPCGLEGFYATSLVNEGARVSLDYLKDTIVKSIQDSFR